MFFFFFLCLQSELAMAHGLTAVGFFFPSLGDHWRWWLWLERSWVHSAALAEWWYYHWADTVQQQKIRRAELNLPGAHRVTVWHQFSHKPTWLKKKASYNARRNASVVEKCLERNISLNHVFCPQTAFFALRCEVEGLQNTDQDW